VRGAEGGLRPELLRRLGRRTDTVVRAPEVAAFGSGLAVAPVFLRGIRSLSDVHGRASEKSYD